MRGSGNRPRITTPAIATARANAAAFRLYSMHLKAGDGSVPTVPLTIDGRYEGEFRVDVGSSATVDLHRPFVGEHGIDERVKKSVTVVSGGLSIQYQPMTVTPPG